MTKIDGGCQCGAVRYEINAEPSFAGHCHCKDCQKSTGVGHATVGGFPEAAIKITGTTKSYQSNTDTGGTATRKFCPECGGRISYQTSNMPGMVLIMAGSLDQPELLQPTMAVFGKRRLAWDHMDGSIATFDAMPPPSPQ